ncbi:MAG: hypothetical protein NW224_20135 [Leptolyngbyaceae cyanobacterium bins.302]|nr:hypothetical protein [Leptolyngbyaceae cyanobacterium bins.302]
MHGGVDANGISAIAHVQSAIVPALSNTSLTQSAIVPALSHTRLTQSAVARVQSAIVPILN